MQANDQPFIFKHIEDLLDHSIHFNYHLGLHPTQLSLTHKNLLRRDRVAFLSNFMK